MHLDLRDGPAAGALEEVSREVREPYVELVSRLSAGLGRDLDWWVHPLACRNTYICPLYVRLCQLVLCRRHIQSGQCTSIVVDSRALGAIVSNLAGPAFPVKVVGASSLTRDLAGAARRYAGSLFHVASQYACAHLVSHARALPAGPIVVVDIFLEPDSVERGTIRDRYYPGLVDCLTDSERELIYFAPIYYHVRRYWSFFRRLSKVRDRLLLKEDVLHLSDYVYALGQPFRVRRPSGRMEFLGMDVGPLVLESFVQTLGSSSAVEGLLRYRFAWRLRQAGVQPVRIIEWFENQEVDHGAVAGWREFFPKTPVVGYQGFFASRHYMCKFPTRLETDLKLVPGQVAVPGPGMGDEPREFDSRVEVVTAPAFRFQGAWQERTAVPDGTWFTVLIPLPIHHQQSHRILDFVGRAMALLHCPKPVRIWLKPHPTWRRADLRRLSTHMPAGCETVLGKFEELLDRSDALVGAASSACVHAVARGTPVAIIGEPGRLLENPIPKWVDHSLWSVCYAASDLAHALAEYASRDPDEVRSARHTGRRLRDAFFVPVTRASVLRFLGLDGCSAA